MDAILNLPSSVETIIRLLNHNGEEIYAVGGCVRDMLQRKKPNDWDLCTSAKPSEMMELFQAKGFCVMPTGLRQGTITVMIEDEAYEVTSFRMEGDYTDGRHPDSVVFTKSLKEDLARRDFTMNAIAYHPDEGFIDPFGGVEDVRHRLIRCVGPPSQRFQEDALRILRAIRFAAHSGFAIDGDTAEAIHKHSPLLRNVSQERKRDELVKILLGQHAGAVLIKYQDVIAKVIPELEPCFGFQQNNPYHIYDVWRHTVEAVMQAAPDPVIRLTMLLHDIAKPQCWTEDEKHMRHFHGHGKISAGMAKPILERLRLDRATIDTIVELIRIHDRFIEANAKSVRRLLQQIGPEQYDRLLQVRAADVQAQNPVFERQRLDKIANLKVIKSRILSEKDCFSLKDLAVDGNDLIAQGFCPGPQIGKVLRALLDEVLSEPALNKKEILLQLAQAQKEAPPN